MTSKVLYIEDNLHNIRLVEKALRSFNYEFLKAQTGAEGLDMAETHLPDLILLDINLPDIKGYEVAKQIRASEKDALLYVPIIALTANALSGDAEKAIEAGCDTYMPKPINIRELRARTESILKKPSLN